VKNIKLLFLSFLFFLPSLYFNSITPQYLASSSVDREIKLWKNLNKCVKVLQAPSNTFCPDATFHPMQENIITFISKEKRFDFLRRYDVLNKRELNPITPKDFSIQVYTHHPTEKDLLALAQHGTIHIYDTKRKKYIATLENPGIEKFFAVSFPANITEKAIVFSCADDKRIKVWDIETERCIRLFEVDGSKAISIAPHPENKNHLATSSDRGEVSVWDLSKGKCLKTLSESYAQSSLPKIVFHSTITNMVATASYDRKVRLWDIKAGSLVQTLGGHQGRVYDVEFCPEHEHIAASCSFDKTVKVWDWRKKRCIKNLTGHKKTIKKISFSPIHKDRFAQEDEDQRIGFLQENLIQGINIPGKTTIQTQGAAQLLLLKSLLSW